MHELQLPVRQVQGYPVALHDMYLSVGEIVELVHAVRKQLQGQADQLLEQVRRQPVVHQDETGWRQNGQNGYVWVVASEGPEPVRYYEYIPSRSHHVALRLIGERYRGTLVSDFYAAYNLLPGRHQRCRSHLLGDLHDLKEAHAAREDVVQWAIAVRQLYDEGKTWVQTHAAPTLEEWSHKHASLNQRACALDQRHMFDRQHPCWALAKRLLRHQEELFQFVLVPRRASR